MDEIAPDQIPEVLDRLSRVKRKWYDFGMGLDIRTSDLDAIRNRCISSRESMAEVIKIWHQGVAKATWRSLARALRGVKETKLADEIERNLSDELDKGAMVVEEGKAVCVIPMLSMCKQGYVLLCCCENMCDDVTNTCILQGKKPATKNQNSRILR